MSAHSGVRRSESIPGGQAGYRAADEIRGGARSPKFVGTPTASTAWRGAWQALCVAALPTPADRRILAACEPPALNRATPGFTPRAIRTGRAGSASRNRTSPPSAESRPPTKSAVTCLRFTAGSPNGRGYIRSWRA